MEKEARCAKPYWRTALVKPPVTFPPVWSCIQSRNQVHLDLFVSGLLWLTGVEFCLSQSYMKCKSVASTVTSLMADKHFHASVVVGLRVQFTKWAENKAELNSGERRTNLLHPQEGFLRISSFSSCTKVQRSAWMRKKLEGPGWYQTDWTLS